MLVVDELVCVSRLLSRRPVLDRVLPDLLVEAFEIDVISHVIYLSPAATIFGILTPLSNLPANQLATLDKIFKMVYISRWGLSESEVGRAKLLPLQDFFDVYSTSFTSC